MAEARVYHVLFLCTGNSARSILAEAFLNRLGRGRFRGFSAGSHPKGEVHPLALALLREDGEDVRGLRSKAWDEFARPGAPQMDFVFTVCDAAAGESCPVWPGQPVTAHWGVDDPAAFVGSPEDQKEAFRRVYRVLQRRIELLTELDIASLDRLSLRRRLEGIGREAIHSRPIQPPTRGAPMPSISMHSASVPIFVRMLSNMLVWLDKAEKHAAAKGFDPKNYLGLRLTADMLPFSAQIQIASDSVKGCLSRLAAVEAPKWADEEATLDELRARIKKTIDYALSIPAAKLDGSEAREITVPMGGGRSAKFPGEVFLKHFSLPNFFFHCTMTYALLRSSGVELGKADFLGGA